MTITVLDIDAGAEVTHFLNAETVGAKVVEGTAFRLAPGGALGPLEEPERYQLFYVTAGEPVARFQGERHELKPGCGIYCDPGEPCAFENPAETPAALYRFVV